MMLNMTSLTVSSSDYASGQSVHRLLITSEW